ncbi:MAG: hypothetical protein HZC14_01075 [Candidatus Niyogibacteria bacterium]|nr:hypothetical protein [Candidatus Niyogibacteria bacterium]
MITQPRNKKSLRALKAVSAAALVFILLSTATPPMALAGSVGGTGGATEVSQLGQWASDIASWAKEFANNLANIATAKLRKQLLDTIVNQIIISIQGKGNPKFVNDLGGMLEDVVKNAGALTLQELTGKDFMEGLCQPNWAINIKAALTPAPTFGEKALCSLDQIGANYNDFMGKFTNGGWSNWIKISESNNNPYVIYMTALNEKLTRQATKQGRAEEEAAMGLGFLGDKVCETETHYASAQDAKDDFLTVESGLTDSETEFADKVKKTTLAQEPYHDYKCVSWITRTPGKILADATSKSLFKDMDWLTNNADWESYMVAIGDALINRLTTEGVAAIKKLDIKAGGTLDVSGIIDLIPPATAATIIDPWRIKLSPNEPSKTAYTLDGTEPTFYAKTAMLYQNIPIAVISSTHPGSTPKSLRWRSTDEGSNTEDTRMLPLAIRTPFNLSEISSYLATQDASVPTNIQNELKSFINQESQKMLKLADDTSIPKNLIDALKSYIAIEDFRISVGKTTVIPSSKLSALKAMVANPALYTISDFINNTQSIAVLADMFTEATNLKQARIDLKTVVNYTLTAVGTGFNNITLIQLADALRLSPEFASLLTETERIIAERSLVKLVPWDTTKIYTVIAAVDSHSFVLLPSRPSVIAYKVDGLTGWEYYTGKITLPNDKEYSVYWNAYDYIGGPEHAGGSIKFKPPFPNSELPYSADLIAPIAEIKNGDNLALTKDASGFITLDPSPSVDFDITPNIVGYEWSFSGKTSFWATSTPFYDWESFDLNRDGTFEKYGCSLTAKADSATNPDPICAPTTGLSLSSPATVFSPATGYSPATGFSAMSIVDANNGIIKVKLSPATTSSEIRTITLRVTDDEGLTTEKSVTVTLP